MFLQIWEGGDAEITTLATIENKTNENLMSWSTQLMQGGDKAWGGREKRLVNWSFAS